VAIEFDSAKNAANIAKHGVSLERASELALDEALIEVDDRKDYGETRINAYGLVDGRVFALTFTMRRGQVRAISLWRASGKETARWMARERRSE
jgi:uncharacterized DUF497 family protein